MLDSSSLRVLLHLEREEYLWILFSLSIASFVCNVTVAFYAKQGDFFKTFFSRKLLIGSILFCVFDFIFCVWLYGYELYAWYIFILLCGFYILAYIDCLFLAVPDLLNFLVFFVTFCGLYYLDLLTQENIISALCVAGAFALLKIFGSFVFKKEIMGEADIVVLASMGAIMGIYWSIYLVLIASVVAMGYILFLGLSSFKDKQISLGQIRIPFVLFLMIGLVVTLFYVRFPIFGELSV